MAKKQAVVQLVAETQQFDSKMARSKKNLQDFGKAAPTQSTDKFSGALSKVSSVASKASVAIAAVAVAVKAYNKTVDSMQESADAAASRQRALNSATDAFWRSLNQGNFAGFLNGLGDIAKRAKEASAALDRVWNSQQAMGFASATYGVEFQDKLNDARDKSLTEEQRSAAIKEAEGILAKQREYASNYKADEIRAGWALIKETMTKAEAAWVDANYKTVQDVNEIVKKVLMTPLDPTLEAKYSAASNRVSSNQKYALPLDSGKGEASWRDPKTGLSYPIGQQTMLESIIWKNIFQTRKDEDGDKGLTAVQGHFTNVLNSEREILSMEKALIRLKNGEIETEKPTTTTTTGTTAPTYEDFSVDYYKNLVSEETKKLEGLSIYSEEYEIQKEIVASATEGLKMAEFHVSELGRTLQSLRASQAVGYEGGVQQYSTSAMSQMSTFNPQKQNQEDDKAWEDSYKGMIQLQDAEAGSWLETARLQDEWDELQKSMSSKAVDELAGAFSRLGSAIGGTAGEIVSLVGAMGQQVATGIATIATLKAQEQAHRDKMTAELGDAAAGAMAAHSSIPFVGVALGVGMVATIVATLMSLPKFEHGGVVGGNSTSGDKILARLNSGEGVLTAKGMRNLGSAFSDENRIGGGLVEFKIRDSELYGILRNYNSKAARRV